MTLYKYNIDIDYHHIKNKNEERYTKKEMSSNKISECNTTFYDTYMLQRYNIGIDYNHNKKKTRDIPKRKKLNNKSNKCHTRYTRFNATYKLYK